MFFCSGIAISSAFDIWLEENIRRTRGFIFFHILLPMVLLLTIATIYFSTLDSRIVIGRIKIFQVFILIYSMVYSSGSKIQLGLVKQEYEAEESTE